MVNTTTTTLHPYLYRAQHLILIIISANNYFMRDNNDNSDQSTPASPTSVLAADDIGSWCVGGWWW